MTKAVLKPTTSTNLNLPRADKISFEYASGMVEVAIKDDSGEIARFTMTSSDFTTSYRDMSACLNQHLASILTDLRVF